MRTLFCASLVGLLGVAGIHCAADGAGAADFDAGPPPIDLPGPADTDASTVDAANDAEVEDAATCSADDWCPTQLPNTDYQLNAVWSFAADDAIAATATSLLHWDGASWTEIDAPEAAGLSSLWASSTNDIWGVARFNHRLVHGTRAAAGQPFHWSKVEYDSAVSPSFELIRGFGDRELWVYGRTFEGIRAVQRGVIMTESDGDGGSSKTVTWTTLPIDDPMLNDVSSFWVGANHEVWLAGIVAIGISGTGGVVRGVPKTDGSDGYTWAEVLTGEPGDFIGLTGIWAESDSRIWSIGNLGQNFHGAVQGDGGVDWTAVPSNANTPMNGIWGVDKDDVWVVGRSGAVRHWDGTKWSVSRLSVGGIPMWQDLNGVHVGPAGDVWAVGSGIALHRAGGSP